MKTIFLVSAILFMFIGHMIREIRWEFLIGVYQPPDRKSLFRAISFGYAANYILPYKLGDIVRALTAGRAMEKNRSLAFSTIIVDRFFDIVAVGIIFCIISMFSKDTSEMKRIVAFYVLLSLLCVATAVLSFFYKRYVKRLILFLARLFNEKIEGVILDFSWALVSNIKDIFAKLNPVRLISYTVLMWGAYSCAYYLFSIFLSHIGEITKFSDVFMEFFVGKGLAVSTGGLTAVWSSEYLTNRPIALVMFTAVPLVLLFIVSLVAPAVRQRETTNLLPQTDEKDKRAFLEKYFLEENREFLDCYLQINRNISVIRDCSAGSNATTMLCMDPFRTFYRKYAFGADSKKLYDQVKWIEKNRSMLSLPEIIRSEKTDIYCYYDMPCFSHSVGLFEYVHSAPVEQGWNILEGVLTSLERTIYREDLKPCSKKIISCYWKEKVEKNLEKIRKSKKIGNLQQYEYIVINGGKYKNLPFYEKYLTENVLQTVFEEDTYSIIHGDLTIENIICTRSEKGEDGFYLIDPNGGNIHESPNLDYAKVLQSIHGGYEFLMSANEPIIEGNKISFVFAKSSAYEIMYQRFRQYLSQRYENKQIRSIFFHEIVHWLRLMPYKIEKDEKKAVLFYAGMLMVMHDVISEYGESLKDLVCSEK